MRVFQFWKRGEVENWQFVFHMAFFKMNQTEIFLVNGENGNIYGIKKFIQSLIIRTLTLKLSCCRNSNILPLYLLLPNDVWAFPSNRIWQLSSNCSQLTRNLSNWIVDYQQFAKIEWGFGRCNGTRRIWKGPTVQCYICVEKAVRRTLILIIARRLKNVLKKTNIC